MKFEDSQNEACENTRSGLLYQNILAESQSPMLLKKWRMLLLSLPPPVAGNPPAHCRANSSTASAVSNRSLLLRLHAPKPLHTIYLSVPYPLLEISKLNRFCKCTKHNLTLFSDFNLVCQNQNISINIIVYTNYFSA